MTGTDDPRQVIGWAGVAGWAVFSLVRANHHDGTASTYPVLAAQVGVSHRHIIRLVQTLEAGGLVSLRVGGGRNNPTTVLPYDANPDTGVTLSSPNGRVRNHDNRDTHVRVSMRNSDTTTVTKVTNSDSRNSDIPPHTPPSSSSIFLKTTTTTTTTWPGMLGDQFANVCQKFAELSPELTARGVELLLADVEREVGAIETAPLETGLRSGWLVVERKLAGAAAGTAKPVASLKPYIRSVLLAQIREARGVHA